MDLFGMILFPADCMSLNLISQPPGKRALSISDTIHGRIAIISKAIDMESIFTFGNNK